MGARIERRAEASLGYEFRRSGLRDFARRRRHARCAWPAAQTVPRRMSAASPGDANRFGGVAQHRLKDAALAIVVDERHRLVAAGDGRVGRGQHFDRSVALLVAVQLVDGFEGVEPGGDRMILDDVHLEAAVSDRGCWCHGPTRGGRCCGTRANRCRASRAARRGTRRWRSGSVPSRRRRQDTSGSSPAPLRSVRPAANCSS